MSDRELLELAAKAAGEKVYAVASQEKNGTVTFYKEPELFYWNPLTDDGDALRLAMHCGMRVSLRQADADGGVIRMIDGDPDEMKATRRAIVRAAAAIGKEMQ